MATCERCVAGEWAARHLCYRVMACPCLPTRCRHGSSERELSSVHCYKFNKQIVLTVQGLSTRWGAGIRITHLQSNIWNIDLITFKLSGAARNAVCIGYQLRATYRTVCHKLLNRKVKNILRIDRASTLTLCNEYPAHPCSEVTPLCPLSQRSASAESDSLGMTE